MYEIAGILAQAMHIYGDTKTDILMQEKLSPEDYKEWKAEKTKERRHQELCSAIRSVKNETVIKRYYF